VKIAPRIVLSDEERKRLATWSRGRSIPARLVLRAKIVLAAAEGKTNEDIAADLGASKPTVGRWRTRFAALRTAGIEKDASRPGRPPAISAATVTRIVEKTTREKPENATHWSTRSMAKAVGVSKDTVRRVWEAHGLKTYGHTKGTSPDGA
jgi:transposase